MEQLAERTPWSPARIRNMIHAGIFKEGEHYFRGPWGRRPVFSWKAVVRFIEGRPNAKQSEDDENLREARRLLGEVVDDEEVREFQKLLGED